MFYAFALKKEKPYQTSIQTNYNERHDLDRQFGHTEYFPLDTEENTDLEATQNEEAVEGRCGWLLMLLLT